MPDQSDETKTAIMEATYEVLVRDGYDELTTERIAAACDRSQGVVHYHYETKDALLASFIDYLLGERTERLAETDETPADRLAAALGTLLPERLDRDRWQYTAVSLELHTQARHNELFQQKLSRRDRRIRDRLAAIIHDGIDDGVFRSVDPDQFVFRLLALVDGAMLRAVTLDETAAIDAARREIERAVRADLLAENRDWTLPTD